MARPAELPIVLESGGTLPLYAQIARAIAADIRRGRLPPGAPLPGSRSLALTLEVHRNTVLAAYAELAAEGWVVARPAGGTFVSELLPEARSRRFAAGQGSAARPSAPAFTLRPEIDPALLTEAPRAELSMFGGVPDLRLLPVGMLARAHRRALSRHGAARLDYASPAGEPRLRAALAALATRRRALAARPENVLVTRGSQMALDLAVRALCAPGDAVAVEVPGYRAAWRTMVSSGVRLVPVPVDHHGLRVDVLARALERERVRAVYVTPHHQYPTTAVLAPGRRIELLELAARARVAVLEDDYDHEFHYEGRPILPLASADARGSVIYIGTLSKVLAPGLRIGFIVAPEALIARLARDRFACDRQGDHVLEAAVAELIEDGELERHVRKMRRLYHARRDALLEALARELEGRFEPRVPPGGMALWGRALGGVDVERWRARALELGVAFLTAKDFTLDGEAEPCVRLGYAALDTSEIDEAVRRLARAWPSGARSTVRPAAARATARAKRPKPK